VDCLLSDCPPESKLTRDFERTLFPEVPPRVEYTIIAEGRDLRRTLIPVLRWGNDFEAHGSKRSSA
jgi:DNA-binding HxlR family transcriptional regulator